MGDLQIMSSDARLRAVFGVVGEFGDLIQIVVVERLHADDRAKDLAGRGWSLRGLGTAFALEQRPKVRRRQALAGHPLLREGDRRVGQGLKIGQNISPSLWVFLPGEGHLGA